MLRGLPADQQFRGVGTLNSILRKARGSGWDRLPIGEIVARVGTELLGTPYVGWTLEQNADREFCYVTLQGLDCVTFFESSLGISRMIKAGESTPDDLIRQVTTTRYRKGRVGGYPSRLHYASDWIRDNSLRGHVKNITPNLIGAIPLGKYIDFMSRNTKVYRQLVAHPELVREIEATEQELSRVANGPSAEICYLPTSKVAEAERELKSGDIVAIATSITGMDCSHTGLIQLVKGEARFLHASSAAKKVVLGPRISEYLKESSKAIGLMVARPI